MNGNYRGQHNQQNTRDGRENLRCWRHYRGNRFTGQKNFKANKFLTPNIQDIWGSMKRPNLRTIDNGQKKEKNSSSKAQKIYLTKP